MVNLQKFKLLATQCAVARSPNRSPAIHLRRRRSTIRILLSLGGGGCGGGRRLQPRREVGYPDHRPRGDAKSSENGKEIVASHKLKDLFVSSPPAFEERGSENMREGLLPVAGGGGVRSRRPLSAMFRQRLLRRAWRPVLVAIPEWFCEKSYW